MAFDGFVWYSYDAVDVTQARVDVLDVGMELEKTIDRETERWRESDGGMMLKV